MGVVNLDKTSYDNNVMDRSYHNPDIGYYEKILRHTMSQMYSLIYKQHVNSSHMLNIEGQVESTLMRSVHTAMSHVRHDMKSKKETIED